MLAIGVEWGLLSAVAISSNSKYCVAGTGFSSFRDNDYRLRLWSIATGECVRLYEGHTQAVDSVDISRNGKFALSGARDHTLRLWDMATGECLRTWEIKSDFIDPVRFSSDCKYVLAGTEDRNVKVEVLDWELGDREASDWSFKS